jgi:uncharacterized SAM-binding protein YcdF (DUF218 family)
MNGFPFTVGKGTGLWTIGLIALVFGLIWMLTSDGGIRSATGETGLSSPAGSMSGPGNESISVIYVPGGAQPRLEKRFQKAAALYRGGEASKVLIMSRPGNTEYSPALSRNLTNDEWSVGRLTDLGVRPSDIETVPIPGTFWGTYNEAKWVSKLILSRGYGRLILISSPHHAERLRNTFLKFLGPSRVNMEIYLSDDPAGRSDLVLEYIKLLVYDHLLLPIS